VGLEEDVLRDLKVESMAKVICPDCSAEFDVPDDVMVGEIVSCPDCGLDLEVVKVEGSNVELQRIAIEKEDWGE